MRVTQSTGYRNFLVNVQDLNERLETASQQVSTGKKLIHLKDSPTGSAELVELRSETNQIDQYRSNADNGSFFLNVTDSALSSTFNLLTDVFQRGSAAATTAMSAEVRAGIAQEIRAARDQIFSLANQQSRGRYLFAGSRVTTLPFSIAGDTVTYVGDSEVNKINIGDGAQVQQGLAGGPLFDPVFNTINSLLQALDSGDQTAIKVALGSFSGTFSAVSQARAQVGMELGKIDSIQYEHDTRETAIRLRRSRVEDADLTDSITQLNQLQTALKATLSAQAAIQQRNLFDYMG